MSVPLWAWIGTLAVFAALISADLALTSGTHGSGGPADPIPLASTGLATRETNK
jgi:hypothetical protein